MGRKTYESIGKALPGRRNVIVTRQAGFSTPGCEVAGSLDEALVGDVFVLGGGEIYAQAMPKADCMELTLVDAAVQGGDTYFPGWDAAQWREVAREEHAADERHAHAFAYVTLRRATSC